MKLKFINNYYLMEPVVNPSVHKVPGNGNNYLLYNFFQYFSSHLIEIIYIFPDSFKNLTTV